MCIYDYILCKSYIVYIYIYVCVCMRAELHVHKHKHNIFGRQALPLY